MDDRKRNLKGSDKRDIFKQKHKELDRRFYACDADFCLIHKYPPGTVAYLDYKVPGDRITFSEVIQYNEWMKRAPVFIVTGIDPENGPFRIERYLGGNFVPDPPTVNLEFVCNLQDWKAFGGWERGLRNEYHKRNGWEGNLRTQEVL